MEVTENPAQNGLNRNVLEFVMGKLAAGLNRYHQSPGFSAPSSALLPAVCLPYCQAGWPLMVTRRLPAATGLQGPRSPPRGVQPPSTRPTNHADGVLPLIWVIYSALNQSGGQAT